PLDRDTSGHDVVDGVERAVRSEDRVPLGAVRADQLRSLEGHAAVVAAEQEVLLAVHRLRGVEAAAVGQDQDGVAAGQEDVGPLADLLTRELPGGQTAAGPLATRHPAVLDLVADTR